MRSLSWETNTVSPRWRGCFHFFSWDPSPATRPAPISPLTGFSGAAGFLRPSR
jgi:hypothetical protein